MHPVKSKITTSVGRSCILEMRKGTACLETEKGSNEEQEDPRPKYYHWTEPSHEGNLDCKGIIAQRFLCLGSLSRATQLELSYTAVPLNKFA